jgi:hypothetical protein
MRPLEASTDGVSTIEQVVLNSPLLPVVNGGYGLAKLGFYLMHI